jgi:ribosomal protein S12 methylthiotransferase
MQLQEEISKNRLKAKVGKTVRVLIDEVTRSGGVGRSAADAPEIDGVVYVKPPFEPHKKLVVGQFVDVEITASDAHDLWGAAL